MINKTILLLILIPILRISICRKQRELKLELKQLNNLSNKYKKVNSVHLSPYLGNNSRYNLQPPSPSETLQKEGTRAALLSRYTALSKKNKQLKSKRKPIYTNSNVEFLSSDKLNNSFKKYSMDQSNEILPRKTIE